MTMKKTGLGRGLDAIISRRKKAATHDVDPCANNLKK